MSLLKSLFSSKTGKSRGSQTKEQPGQDPSGSTAVPQMAQVGYNLQRSVGNMAMNKRAGNKQKDSSGSDSSAQLAARQQLLDQERDSRTPPIAEMEYNWLVGDAIRKTTEFAMFDKDTASIREGLKQLAVDAVSGNIDKTDYSPEEKADAKQYAAEHVERQVIVPKTMHKYADHLVKSSVSPRVQLKDLQEAAKTGFQEVTPNLAIPPEKQVEEAVDKARRKAREEADRVSHLLHRRNRDHLLNVVRGNLKFIAEHMEISASLGVSEVEKRHQLEDALVDDLTISNVYTGDLLEPLTKTVARKLGVGRKFWQSKSREVKEFRKKLKEAGRAQAREDIGNQADSAEKLKDANDTEKDYYKMIASKHARKLAKGSVDKAVEAEAGEIIKRILPLDPTKKELKAAAQTSAYSIARSNPQDEKKIKDKALQGARAKASDLLKQAQAKAVNEARKIYKGDKNVKASRPDVSKQNDLITSVKEQVTKDDVAGAAIKQAFEADSLNSGFTKMSRFLNMVAPNDGDSASFEFELKIPVHESGVHILFGLEGEVERDLNEFTVGAQISFGAGWTNFGFDANFRVGVFMEAQSKNAVGAMNLVSYGLYREVRRISHKAADYLWSYGGKSGKSKREEAELWAAMIEQKYMGDDGYVDIGVAAQLSGEANAGVAKGGASVGVKLMNRFDKEAIERLSPGTFGKTSEDKAKNIKGGNTRLVFEAGLEAEAQVGGVAFGLSAEGSFGLINRRPRELEISVSGSLPFLIGEETADAAKYLAQYAIPAVSAIKNTINTLKKKVKKDPNFDTANGVASQADALTSLSSLTLLIPKVEEFGENFVSLLQGEEEVNNALQSLFTGKQYAETVSKEIVNKIALANTLDISLSLSLEWDGSIRPSEWEIGLEVSHTKSFEIDVELAKIAVEKSSRLGSISIGSEGFQFDILGITNKK